MPPAKKKTRQRSNTTRQRAAIDGVLAEAAGPLTAEDVWKRARKIFPRISLRTVFRNLQERAEERSLSRVSFPGQPAAYEKPARGHHPHFSCLKCGKIFRLDMETPDLRDSCDLPKGFKPVGCELTFYGHCATCGGNR